MCTGIEIAAILGVALAAGTSAYSLSKGTPSPPPLPPPPPAPPPVPPPLAAPPPPAIAAPELAVADEATRLRRRRGLSSTILTSPLGIASLPSGSDKLGA